MSPVEGATPGRRLSDAESQIGAGMFDGGASESEVAVALGCSRSTAHRLRLRLAAGHGGDDQDDDGDALDAIEGELAGTEASALRAELADALATRRGQLAAQLADYQGRAAASEAAIRQLDAERLRLLEAGQDPAPLRARRASADADYADAVDAARIVAGKLADMDMQIAAIRAERQQEEARAAAEEATRLGDDLAPRAAQALQAVVEGDAGVKALVDVAGRLVAAELASGRSWDHLVLPPSLRLLAPGARDPWHGAVCALWSAARQGDQAAVMAALPYCQPWQPRDREEYARLQAEAAERQAAASAEAAAVMAATRPRQPGNGVATRPDFIATMREVALRSVAERRGTDSGYWPR